MQEYIEEYLGEVSKSIVSKVDGSFISVKTRVDNISDSLTNIENEINKQVNDVDQQLEESEKKLEHESSRGKNLLINTEQASISKKTDLVCRQEELIKDVQLKLYKDDTLWR